MKKRWRVVALGICMAMLTCACSTQAEKEDTSSTQQDGEKKETAEEKAEKAKQAKLDLINPAAYGNVDGLELEKGTYLSIIGKGSSETYWKTIKAGAEDAVADLNKELGYEGSDKIKVVYSGPGKSDDVDEQVSILDEELDRYPAALAIAIVDSKSCEVQFDLATMNGIPLITFDSVGNYQGIMASVMTDNAKASTEVATHMVESLGDAGQVVVIAHDSKSLTSQERVNNFIAEIQNNHPNMSVAGPYYMDQIDDIKKTIAEQQLDIVPVEGQELDEEQQTALDDAIAQITDEDIYNYILEMNPDVKGIFATNGDTTMQALTACEGKDMKDVVIMGYDADQEEIDAMKDGRIAGIIVQNPYGMGYATVVAEARCALNMGNEANVNTGYTWVTPDNIEDRTVQDILYAEK